MPRFFVGTDQISDKNIVITGTDVNHIRNVLRMAPGEEVTVSDGQGMDYFCKIAELTKEETGCEEGREEAPSLAEHC